MRALTFAALVVCCLSLGTTAWIVGETVKANGPVMLDAAREAKEEARFLFLRDCTRKNPLKVCESVK